MWLAKQTKLASRPSNFGDRTNQRNHGCNHIDERRQERQQQKAPPEQQQKLHPRTTTTTIYVVGCHAAFSDRCCWVPSRIFPVRCCWLPCRFFCTILLIDRKLVQGYKRGCTETCVRSVVYKRIRCDDMLNGGCSQNLCDGARSSTGCASHWVLATTLVCIVNEGPPSSQCPPCL